MSDDGSTKDDVKVPDGEIGDKIKKLFVDDGKDTSKPPSPLKVRAQSANVLQTSLFSPLWVRRPLLMPRRLQNKHMRDVKFGFQANGDDCLPNQWAETLRLGYPYDIRQHLNQGPEKAKL